MQRGRGGIAAAATAAGDGAHARDPLPVAACRRVRVVEPAGGHGRLRVIEARRVACQVELRRLGIRHGGRDTRVAAVGAAFVKHVPLRTGAHRAACGDGGAIE